MSLYSLLTNAFQRKSVEMQIDNNDLRLFELKEFFVNGVHNHAIPESELANIYNESPIVYAIVNLVKNQAKNFKIYRYKNGKKESKNATTDFELDFDLAILNLMIYGFCVIRQKGKFTTKAKYEVLKSWEIRETSNGKMLSVNNAPNEPKENFLICSYVSVGNSSMLGSSPLNSAKFPLATLKEMYISDHFLLENKGYEGMLTNDSDAPITPTESAELAFNRKIGGASKTGKIAFSTAKLRYIQLGRSPKEMALWDGYIYKLRDICNIYSAPATLFGDYQSSTLANYEQSVLKMYNDCTIPIVNKILSAFKGVEDLYLDTSGVLALASQKIIIMESKNKELDTILKLNAEIKAGNITKEIATNILVENYEYSLEEALKYLV